MVKRYSNGLRLVVKNMGGLMSVSMGIMANMGSIKENDDNNGLSHFVEHMLFKGTKKRTAVQISNDFDNIGAQANAFTAKEHTCYYAKATMEHMEESFEILADLFLNSTFDEEELEKERSVILEEISMVEDTPDDLCLDCVATAMYGDNNVGRKILGSAENVKKFVRQDFIDFVNRYYTPKNVVISFAGNVTMEKAEELVEKYFLEGISKRENNLVVEDEFTGFKTNQITIKKDIEQSNIAIALPLCEYENSDSNALSVFNTVFGGGLSSRLFQSIREKQGLAYTVQSYISSYISTGSLIIYGGVNPKNNEKYLKSVILELEKIKKDGIMEEEFVRAKEQIKASFAFSQENSTSQMSIYGRHLIYTDKLFDFDKRLQEINSLTLSCVNEIINKYIDTSKIACGFVGKSEFDALSLIKKG